jgi:molecular chaperone GrpE
VSPDDRNGNPADASASAGAPGVADDDEVVEVELLSDEEEQLLADSEDLFVDGTPAPSAVEAERDEYRETLQRVKAEFDNYRKRVARERQDMVDQAAQQLVSDLLPVLDACEAAAAQGLMDVEPVHKALSEILEKAGLEPMEAVGEPFDPNRHEAVLSEEGDGGEPVVVDSLRTGYSWNGRVLRPAMVKVRA